MTAAMMELGQLPQTPPKRMDLSAKVITKPDLEKPEIHKLLYPPVK